MQISNTTNYCVIWDVETADILIEPSDGYTSVTDSARTDGGYLIENRTINIVRNMTQFQKARLTTIIINQRIQSVDLPVLTQKHVEECRTRSSLLPDERARRLLRYFVRESGMVGTERTLAIARNNPDAGGAFAWSESTSVEEVDFLYQYLVEKRWLIEINRDHDQINGVFGPIYRYDITVEGYSQVAELSLNQDSSQCFVAMWFGNEVDDLYDIGIEPGIVSAGYDPIRIDRKEDVLKIDDAIIAEIRRSRFLLADFTHGCNGARGGVYYEAGFAHGLGLPVVFTCRADMVEEIHFDTRQYFHVLWERGNYEAFRESLRDRIIAMLGEGPLSL